MQTVLEMFSVCTREEPLLLCVVGGVIVISVFLVKEFILLVSCGLTHI